MIACTMTDKHQRPAHGARHGVPGQQTSSGFGVSMTWQAFMTARACAQVASRLATVIPFQNVHDWAANSQLPAIRNIAHRHILFSSSGDRVAHEVCPAFSLLTRNLKWTHYEQGRTLMMVNLADHQQQLERMLPLPVLGIHMQGGCPALSTDGNIASNQLSNLLRRLLEPPRLQAWCRLGRGEILLLCYTQL